LCCMSTSSGSSLSRQLVIMSLCVGSSVTWMAFQQWTRPRRNATKTQPRGTVKPRRWTERGRRASWQALSVVAHQHDRQSSGRAQNAVPAAASPRVIDDECITIYSESLCGLATRGSSGLVASEQSPLLSLLILQLILLLMADCSENG
jgi:hypothetical protein